VAKPPKAAALSLERLTVDYGGLRALDDVSIEVGKGRIVGLIGPNGAGKTTLFDAALGLVQLTTGRIQILGEDVTHWPLHRRARLGVGRTFQRLELFGSLSVEDNIIVALESVSSVGSIASEMLRRPSAIDVRLRAQDRAKELLALVGLTEHAQARAADLPMGLARILELARALAIEPKLLLLDEPSSGLNENETDDLEDLLRELHRSQNLSILLVEHDMDFVLGLSQEIYVIDFGKLIAHGTPAKIRRDPAVRAAYLGEEIPAGRSSRR
jgi:branched-chain amino acid transport system ATP-binding protein